MIRYNGKDITPRMGGKDLSRVMWNGLQIWPSSLTTLFTVYSDISGARVEYSSDNLQFSEVGVISGGNAKFEINESDKENGFYIRLTGGVLPSEKATYTFNAQNLSISAEAYSGSINVTSVKSVTTYGMPSVTHVSAGATGVTINAIGSTESGISVGYSPTNAIVIDENMTASAVTKEYTFTQEESGKQVTCTVTQAAGIRYSYTVNYNVPNAVVYAGGENVGTISSGSLTFYKWNSHAESSYSISFSGGSMPSAQSPTYSFSVSPTSLSFGENGSTQYVTVSSSKVTYRNVHNTGTVNRGSSVTIAYRTTESSSSPSYSRSNSGTGISGSGTAITYAANPNTSQRSGTVTYTQDESDKTATVRCTQAAKTVYDYTVYSNCNGGIVYFNGSSKGTILSGSLSFTDTASSGTVSISGGVPSNYTETVDTGSENLGSETEYDYDFSITNGSSAQTFTASGGSSSITVDSSRRSRTVTTYRDYTTTRPVTYSAPSNKTCYGNGSVTMNYTGPSYGSSSTSYGSQYTSTGSWSGWSRVSTSWRYDDPSWITKSSSNSGTYNIIWTFRCNENTGTSSRNDWDELVQSGSNNSIRVNFSQSAQTIEYVFKAEGLFSNADARAGNASSMNKDRDAILSGGIISYKKVGNTYTRLGISTKTKDSQIIDYYASGGSSTGSTAGWDTFTIGFKESPYCSSRINGVHKYSITLQQAESGKILTLSPNQNDYHVNLGSEGKSTDSKTVPWNSANSSSNDYTFYLNASTGKGKTSVLANVSSTDSSCLVNGSSMKTINDGEFVNFRFTSNNNSFSEREGQLSLAVGEKMIYNVCTVFLKQQACPNEFYVKLSSGTGVFAFSRSSVTSLPHSSIIQYDVTTSARSINNLYISSTSLGAPFTSYASQSFKVWRVSGNTATLYRTITVSPGGTVTI